MLTRNPHAKLDNLPPTGRLLALDVGEKRIGLAVSDSARTVATPRAFIPRSKWSALKKTFQDLFTETKATAVVIGLPLRLTGTFEKEAQSVNSLAELIAAECNIPVLLWDERLTTTQAKTALFEYRQGRQTRASTKDIQKSVDSAAATLLLQNVLDALRTKR